MELILVEEITSEKSLDSPVALAKRTSSKPRKALEDEELDEEVTPKKAAKKGKSVEEDEDEDVDVDDDWDGAEEEADDWDPDFDEFDVPKSKKGKSSKGEEEEDFKIEEDEEFKDMDLFNDGGFDDEEEDY